MWSQSNRLSHLATEAVQVATPVADIAGHAGLSRQLLQQHPFALALPENYEPGYAYPLIVSLHANGGSEQHIHGWLPHISSQNYVGLGLRGPKLDRSCMPGRFCWPQRRAKAQESLNSALEEILEDWSVHPHRIHLLGEGAGASIALKLWMRRPERFAGVVCLQPTADWAEQLPPLPGDLSGRLLFGGLNLANSDTIAALDGLGEAGVDLQLIDAPTTDRPAAGKAIDRWIMANIGTAIL
ncbi:MAG: hypothetical protein KDA90_02800 [Planctomycetaceae bacterium]|nr:hypothetical protein [Planctomycetaceae bacterium]